VSVIAITQRGRVFLRQIAKASELARALERVRDGALVRDLAAFEDVVGSGSGRARLHEGRPVPLRLLVEPAPRHLASFPEDVGTQAVAPDPTRIRDASTEA
jgi:hypothetical protein